MTASKTSNWSRVKFGDVVRNVNATTKDPASIGLERVVGLDHMDPESLPLKRWDELSDLNEGTSFTRIFRSGQVLFGKRRAYQKKVSVPDFDGICSGDILVFEPSSDLLLPDFLPYIVQSDGFFEHALGTSAGSLSPRTKWQELAKYEFVLPPVEEQLRITELLATVENSIAAFSQVDVKVLRSALVANPDWRTGQLGDLATLSRDSHLGKDLSAGSRVVGMDDMVPLAVWQQEFSPTGSIGGSLTRFEPGDILYGKLRPNLRKVAISTFDGFCSSEVLVIRPKVGVSVEFLHAVLSSDFFLRSVLKAAKGTKMPRINPSDLLKIEVGVPGAPIQDSLSLRLAGLNDLEAATSRTTLDHFQLLIALRENLLLDGIEGAGA